MAFKHAKTASITVGGTDISTFCDSLELNVSVSTADTTTFGSTWTSALAGLASGTASFSGSWDPTASTGPAAVVWAAISGAVAVAVVHKPGGTASGQRSNTFNAIITAYTESASVDDKVAFSGELLITGAVTTAVI